MPSATQPKLRTLGANGPKIPAVGFGLMGLSIGYGSVGSDEERFAVLDRAWELGCTNWDTADCYTDSEDLVGKWFKLHPERRKDIFLATKFGLVSDGKGGLKVDSTPEHAREAVESSLERLGVDYIDLYYIHRALPDIPIEKTVRVIKEFVEEGKVKAVGLSEVSSDTVRRANATHPISAVQIEYNPWDTDIEGPVGTNLLDTCTELGVSVFAYAPLGRGIITGRFRSLEDFDKDDSRRNLERFKPGNFEKNLVLVDKFAEIAKAKGVTASQLCIAWVAAQGRDNVFAIPGTKSIKYLEENFGASQVELSQEEQKQLRELVQRAQISGTRTPNFGNYVETVPLEE